MKVLQNTIKGENDSTKQSFETKPRHTTTQYKAGKLHNNINIYVFLLQRK